MNVKTCDSPDDPEVVHETKIYYCSRTHSQLTQFANEVRRVRIPPNIEMHSEIGQIGPDLAEDEVKYLSLGSRKNLCINPSVSKLGNSIAINERCLELQQPKIVHEMKCVFLPKKDNESLVNEFRDRTLAQVRDIEDMGSLGKKIGICPYYASRASIKLSEVRQPHHISFVFWLMASKIITLPYPMLLQKSAREALDISLKDHVVIIDEAHNLMDAISSIYSINVSNAQLKRSRAQLGIYLQKFRHKLKGKNRIYITQVVRVLDSLSAYLEAKTAQTGDLEGAVEVSDLMAGKGVDQINLYKLMHYLQESKLARKVEGYNTHTEETQSKTGGSRQLATPVLSHIQSFLQALTNPGAEGRFFYSRTDDNDTSVRYMLLDPTYHFKEIVEEARAVILAGGTMSPVSGSCINHIAFTDDCFKMDDYRRHLFAYLEPDRLKTLSCGHVIPEENLIAWPVTRGPSNIDFDFTFEKRNSTYMMDELGKCLTELSRTVPDGMVVFFPSYAYLQQVVARWQTPGLASSTSRWAQLSKHKTLFRESKDDASVDNVLVQYAAAIEAGDGGLLLSVVGGKMSEGINFSDKLGRGVVVVGLPFPNIQSLEWKAKLEYIENASVSRGETKAEGKKVAREFYENACMRAVNQSIGRAIRHQKDYASIILLDRRYDTPRIAEKLPNWIKQGLVKSADRRLFSDVISRLDRFFKVVRE